MTEAEKVIFEATNVARGQGRYCARTYYPAVAPVTWNPQLAVAARGYAEEMAKLNYFHHDHTDARGRTMVQRADAAGYLKWMSLGENIAAGQTYSDVVDAWLSSPSHCETLMSPSFKELGIGYAENRATEYVRYFVQDFGSRR